MPTYEQIVSQVIVAIKEIVAHDLDIDENTDLISDLEFDSLKVMNLIEDVEDHFDISIPLNVLADVRTIKDLALQLERLTGKN
ncbi:MAG: acyl carrier protein [Desulfobacterales bacterium]|nr:acyl carrier protein [Desulfobacterales bacterium]MDJ0853988.1 acyl carrier protein [Desulfobacterales bacterium]MDJ0886914.1 acyl carrier protein [Desulfobacterales bacterium]MDJ0989892.1 acyl carrier protein [Desulfobacterales bacterium]